MPGSLKRNITLGFSAALVVLAVIGVLSYRSTLSLLSTVDEQSDAQEMITSLEEVLANLNVAVGAHRGYMITHDSAHNPHFRGSLREVEAALNNVDRFTKRYPEDRAAIDTLRALVNNRVVKFQHVLDVYNAGGIAAVAPLIRGDSEDKQINAQVTRIEQSVRRHVQTHRGRAGQFAKLTLSVITVGSITAVVFLILAGIIILSEITKRQRAHVQLRDREERLNDLIESASELIMLLRPDGHITNVNRAWLSTLHYSEREAESADITRIVDKDSLATWREALARALEGERVEDMALDFCTREGERVNLVGGMSCRFDEAGQPSLLRAILRDVTASRRAALQLREHEHRSEQVLESMPLGVFVVNADGSTSYANRAAQEILGRGVALGARPEDLATVYQVYRARDNRLYPTADLPIVKALKGQANVAEDLEVQRDGQRIPLYVSAAPVYTSSGELSGAIATFSDITERRAIERLKDELISVVSHELRTPLTSIRGALGLVGSGRLGTLTDQGRKMIDIATHDTDRLVRLINDMLDIERMQAGRIEMHKTACNAADLVRAAVETVQPLADKADVRIVVAESDVPLNCDVDRIIQTLTNLLGNAIKFSPPRGVVSLQVREISGEIEFRISDQGRGIPPEKLQTIFERFQQVDASDAREKGGAGLGLAISRSIVVQHGGRIWAESDGAHGSTFVFTLPRATTASEAEHADGADTLLLIAEDDSSAAEVLRTMLETNGYSVAVAGTGAEAIEMAQRLQPAAILLDILMPVMDGWEALAELKNDERTKNIPIVVVSGFTTQLEHDDARVAAWVAKPFSEMQLAQALQSAFGMDKEANILIVEDDANLAAVLREQFEASGLRCVTAGNGSEAIRAAQENAPDLLVLDLMLPERDGFEVVDWLRQHERLRNLPLVVYSALELNAAQKQKLTLGPSEFMTKAREEPAEVARRVTRLLKRVSGRRP